MKNIHVLPTDKPSRLFKFANELHLDTIPKDYYKKYNIYITSDEEIKEGEYYLSWQDYYNPPKFVVYVKSSGVNGDGKKIILTTDQDLIADGVQAIDDKFLKWFVNNPSCEFVEVGYGWIRLTETNNEGYWVSIPDNQFEMQQEEPKQETLEEAAERLVNRPYGDVVSKSSFIAGAKWQAERMYSEEEVRELLLMQRGNSYVAILTKTKDKELAAIASTAPEPGGKDGWVKQFKKK